MSSPPPSAPEATLLFLSAGGVECDPAIRALLEGGLDHSRLYALAARERALPVLWERLQRFDLGAMPDEVAESYRRFAAVSHFRLLHLDQRLNEALDALAEAGIPVLLLKGAALGRTVYGSLVRRPMVDLDLLVDPADAERARAVLLGARWKGGETGREDFYRRHHHLAPLEDADGSNFALELHTQPVGGGERFGLAARAFWEASREVAADGRVFRVPSTPHQLVHLAVHLAWSHSLASSAWRTFRDLSAICTAEAVDWDAVVTLGRGGAASCCYWTFALANRLAGVQVPASVLDALRPRGSDLFLRTLERHYATDLLLPGVFPSARLRRTMWALAIRPGRYGHGEARPWDHDELLPSTGSPARHAGTEFVRRLNAWERYLKLVLGSNRAAP